MQRIVKTFISLMLIFLVSISISACDNKKSLDREEDIKVKINDVKYDSLTDAVSEAKSGDTIQIYNDINDNKNVVIDKPLTLKGVVDQSNIKPKFYGALTIDLPGESDSVSIENIEIIHEGKVNDGKNNNTLIGLNLVNGGLEIKSSMVALDKADEAENGASGMLITRKAGSKCTMPILIKGNNFGSYSLSKDGMNGTLIVKKALTDLYQDINTNNSLIFDQNTFAYDGEGNQFISIICSETPEKIDYLVTSSSQKLIDSLINNQPKKGGSYTLKNAAANAEKYDDPVYILEGTSLIIEGNKEADFGGNIFKVSGTVNLDSTVNNATFERQTSTASVIVKQEAKSDSLVIK